MHTNISLPFSEKNYIFLHVKQTFSSPIDYRNSSSFSSIRTLEDLRKIGCRCSYSARSNKKQVLDAFNKQKHWDEFMWK